MDAVKSWDTNYEWKTVTLLTLGFGLVGLDRWIVAPLAPSMIGDLHLTPQDINNLVAILGIAWGVAAIFLGGLSDRIGRRKVLIPAIVVFSLLSGFSGMAMGMTSLLLIRAVMGVSEGAFCPTSFACVAEASKPRRRGFNQGLQQSAFALFGLGFGPIIATQLLGYGMSWRGVFLLVGIPGLILAVLLWMVIREPVTAQGHSHGESVERAPLSSVFKHRNVPLGMLALLCSMCGIFVLSANTPIYLTSYLHLSQSQMGFVTSAIGFGGFLGQWLLAAASDYLGRKLMAILGFAVGAVFIWLFIQQGPDPMMLFILLFIGAGFAFGLLSLITGPIAVEAAPLGLISTAAGIIIGAGEIFGGGIAPVIAGAIASSYGIQDVLYFALGGLVLGVIVSLFLKETAPRKVQDGSDLDRLESRMGTALEG
jgi:predicted MFS family arabinose efflux permease